MGTSTHSGKQLGSKLPETLRMPWGGRCCSRRRGLGERSYCQASLSAPPQIPAPAAPSAHSLGPDELPCMVTPKLAHAPGVGGWEGHTRTSSPVPSSALAPPQPPTAVPLAALGQAPTTRGPTESSTHREMRSCLTQHPLTATDLRLRNRALRFPSTEAQWPQQPPCAPDRPGSSVVVICNHLPFKGRLSATRCRLSNQYCCRPEHPQPCPQKGCVLDLRCA